MIKNGLKVLGIVILALALHKTAFAQDEVSLPTEELARESVLPIFDKVEAVKNRRVVTDGKIELDAFYSYSMTEPIMNVSRIGFAGYYNLTEEHAVGVQFTKNFPGLSTYARQIETQNPQAPYTGRYDFENVPAPEMSFMLDYNMKMFYGKMSLSKKFVINTILFVSAAAEMTKYPHKNMPGVALGIGQKFFFTPQWALRFDMRLHAGQAPIAINAGALTNPNSKYEDFNDRLTYSTTLQAGISYLF